LVQKTPGLQEEQELLTHAAVRDLLLVSLAWNLVRAASILLVHAPVGAALLLLLVQNIFIIVIPFSLWLRGQSRWAAWWMAISASLMGAVYVLISGGIRSSAPFVQIAIAIAATILLGRKGALRVGLPWVAFLAGITAYQVAGGRLPVLLPQAYWASLINVLAAGSIAFAPIPRALRTMQRIAAERQRITAELQVSNLRLEGLIQSVEGIVWERDVETWQFTFVSGQAERILGYPTRKWMEDSDFWLEHIHPDDRNWALAHRKSAAADGKDLSCEYRMLAADGRTVWLRDLVSTVSEDGSALRGLLVDVTRLHRAEDALHNRERCLEIAEAGGALGIWEYNLHTGESGFNGEWRRMFGFPKESGRVSRDDCFARIHADDRGRIEVATEVAIAWDGRFDSQFRVVWPDGSTHWLSGKGQMLSDLSGIPAHFLGMVMDVTDRRQSEAALAETSHFLQAVIDTTPNLIFVVDGRGECILANRRAAEHYGATPRGDAAKQVQVADPGALTFMRGSAEVIRTGAPIVSVEKQPAPDRTDSWFHTIRVPLARPDGTVAALGIATDITGLKRAEESLQEKENHLRAILDTAPECVALTAADGTLLEINPAGLAMMEADAMEQVLGQNMSGLINQEDRGRFEDLNREVFEGSTFRMEFGIIGLKGTHRWLETQSTPLRDGQRNIIAALNVTRDITNRKKTETDLERAAERVLEAKTIAQLGSFSSDLVGGKIAFSPEVCRILGSAPGLLLDGTLLGGTLLGGTLLDGTDEEAASQMLYGDGEQVRTAYRALIAQGKELDLIFRWRRPDNEVRHIHIKGSREQDAEGKPKRIFGVIQDVTVHTQMVERLRQLTEHQEKVREEERTRIAREIHDELGQQLTGLKMRAAWTERLLSSSADAVNADQARVELAAMSEALEATIRTVRRIASELRPPVLDALGLMPALEWLRGSFERDYGIACVTELRCGNVSPEAATTVFRVAQEALTNVARHAGASRVWVRLQERHDALILDVEDDGRGLEADSVSRQGSFGLIGIRERARLSNGNVNLLTSENGGLLLRLTLPNVVTEREAGVR
jgi:PAS domain S-box-containing protein